MPTALVDLKPAGSNVRKEHRPAKVAVPEKIIWTFPVGVGAAAGDKIVLTIGGVTIIDEEVPAGRKASVIGPLKMHVTDA